jgi:ribosomal protein S18 acetylase RimI-like enzyme
MSGTLIPEFSLRPLQQRDRGDVVRLVGPTLARLYPHGDRWLIERLEHAARGQARCTVAVALGHLIGLTIETPKEPGRIKLSTLWVAPESRRLGVGTSLLDTCRRQWLIDGLDRVDVTCAAVVARQLAPLLHRRGFRVERVARNRYGEGRHEVIFSWSPASDREAQSQGPSEAAPILGV